MFLTWYVLLLHSLTAGNAITPRERVLHLVPNSRRLITTNIDNFSKNNGNAPNTTSKTLSSKINNEQIHQSGVDNFNWFGETVIVPTKSGKGLIQINEEKKLSENINGESSSLGTLYKDTPKLDLASTKTIYNPTSSTVNSIKINDTQTESNVETTMQQNVAPVDAKPTTPTPVKLILNSSKTLENKLKSPIVIIEETNESNSTDISMKLQSKPNTQNSGKDAKYISVNISSKPIPKFTTKVNNSLIEKRKSMLEKKQHALERMEEIAQKNLNEIVLLKQQTLKLKDNLVQGIKTKPINQSHGMFNNYSSHSNKTLQKFETKTTVSKDLEEKPKIEIIASGKALQMFENKVDDSELATSGGRGSIINSTEDQDDVGQTSQRISIAIDIPLQTQFGNQNNKDQVASDVLCSHSESNSLKPCKSTGQITSEIITKPFTLSKATTRQPPKDTLKPNQNSKTSTEVSLKNKTSINVLNIPVKAINYKQNNGLDGKTEPIISTPANKSLKPILSPQNSVNGLVNPPQSIRDNQNQNKVFQFVHTTLNSTRQANAASLPTANIKKKKNFKILVIGETEEIPEKIKKFASSSSSILQIVNPNDINSLKRDSGPPCSGKNYIKCLMQVVKGDDSSTDANDRSSLYKGDFNNDNLQNGIANDIPSELVSEIIPSNFNRNIPTSQLFVKKHKKQVHANKPEIHYHFHIGDNDITNQQSLDSLISDERSTEQEINQAVSDSDRETFARFKKPMFDHQTDISLEKSDDKNIYKSVYPLYGSNELLFFNKRNKPLRMKGKNRSINF